MLAHKGIARLEQIARERPLTQEEAEEYTNLDHILAEFIWQNCLD